MRYRIKLEFLCNDHRLRDTVEREVDESELWFLTLSQLFDGMVPIILNRYPYVKDAIDGIELLDLRIEKL